MIYGIIYYDGKIYLFILYVCLNILICLRSYCNRIYKYKENQLLLSLSIFNSAIT